MPSPKGPFWGHCAPKVGNPSLSSSKEIRKSIYRTSRALMLAARRRFRRAKLTPCGRDDGWPARELMHVITGKRLYGCGVESALRSS